ncbi:hypothetical protein DQ04_00731090 [Trypanosoma grayi]|uniref:hypothetical protein n=1 Tax=Trypanosoma grayi TaxID=71804 RepID=UPI0004F48F11|nr:hypothetical protein DQ04_00731090 [Trypanosoma grayi]KEG13887.1 hypothetical protein DQ04_00731090 [Trypanosoma grayi]
MLAGVLQESLATRKKACIISLAATTVGSIAVSLTLYAWWKRRSESKRDDELFGDVSGSPLFDPDVKFPAKMSMTAPNVSAEAMHTGALSTEERAQALRLARELLQQLHGPAHEEGASVEEDSSDSEETNVSLNYHIATEMAKGARDSLVEAVVHGKVMKEHARGKQLTLADFAHILEGAVDYLDISNEREKLRHRRIAAHLVEPQSGGRALAAADQNTGHQVQQRATIDEIYARFFSRTTELDRRLSAPRRRRRHYPTEEEDYDADDYDNDEGEERFEMGWGDNADDDAAEVDLMAYLDQDDAAGYGSRMEARMAEMLATDQGLMYADEGMYDGYEEGEDEDYGDEEEDDDLENAGFDRMLFNKLQQLAASLGNHGAPAGAKGPSGSSQLGDQAEGEMKQHHQQQKRRTGGDENEGREGEDEDDSDDEWETEGDDDEDNTQNETSRLPSHMTCTGRRSKH